MNFGNQIAAGTFIPIVACSLTAIILVEAAGMEEQPMLKHASPVQRTAAMYWSAF